MANSKARKTTANNIVRSAPFRAGVTDKRRGVWNLDDWAASPAYRGVLDSGDLYERGRLVATLFPTVAKPGVTHYLAARNNGAFAPTFGAAA